MDFDTTMRPQGRAGAPAPAQVPNAKPKRRGGNGGEGAGERAHGGSVGAARGSVGAARLRVLGRWVGILALVAGLLVGLGGVAAADGPRTEVLELEVDGTTFAIDAPARMSNFVRSAARVIEAEWGRVSEATGAPSGEHVLVHIEFEMNDWFTRTGRPARTPEWAAGMAISSERTILLAPGNPDWEKTLAHELAHLAVAFASGFGSVPRWVNEGWAVHIAEQFSLDRATILFQAGLFGNYLPFDELETRFPSAATTVSLAYAQSASAVRFLEREYGEGIVARTLGHMKEHDRSFHRAFYEEAGESLGAATEKWQTRATSRFRWAPVATGGGLAWGFMAILAIAVSRRKRKKDRERLAEMERDEGRIFDKDPDDATFGG